MTNEETCGACNGSRRMPRDPDIGTDQECFVCDGSGVIAAHEAKAAPAVPQGEPVACLVRWRGLRTPARNAHDGQDHFSEWSDWRPETLKYGMAVTDPSRNSGPEHLFEMLPLVLATPAAPSQEPGKCAQCKKPYRKGANTEGCPKCAPGVVVPESEFQKPISSQEPAPTGCNCRWDGDTQVQWCELHLAHKDAIHEWAERAKTAEAKLAQLSTSKEPVPLTDTWLLEQFKHHPNWELSTSNDPECDQSVFWLVHEVKGGRNDREWFLIGEGESPRAAIIAALREKEKAK